MLPDQTVINRKQEIFISSSQTPFCLRPDESKKAIPKSICLSYLLLSEIFIIAFVMFSLCFGLHLKFKLHTKQSYPFSSGVSGEKRFNIRIMPYCRYLWNRISEKHTQFL